MTAIGVVTAVSAQLVFNVVNGVVDRVIHGLGNLRIPWLVPSEIDSQNYEDGQSQDQREYDPQARAQSVIQG